MIYRLILFPVLFMHLIVNAQQNDNANKTNAYTKEQRANMDYLLKKGDIPTGIFFKLFEGENDFFPEEVMAKNKVKGADIHFHAKDTVGNLEVKYRTMRMRFNAGKMTEQVMLSAMNSGIQLVGVPGDQMLFFYKDNRIRTLYNSAEMNEGEGRYNFLITNQLIDEYLDKDVKIIIPRIVDIYSKGEQITTFTLNNETLNMGISQLNEKSAFEIKGDTLLSNIKRKNPKKKEEISEIYFYPKATGRTDLMKVELISRAVKDTIITTRKRGESAEVITKEIRDKKNRLVYEEKIDKTEGVTTKNITYDEQGRYSSIQIKSDTDTLEREISSRYPKGTRCFEAEYKFHYAPSGLIEKVEYTTCGFTTELTMDYQFSK